MFRRFFQNTTAVEDLFKEDGRLNFLWDIVLRAEEQGQREDELFFKQAERYTVLFLNSPFPVSMRKKLWAVRLN